MQLYDTYTRRKQELPPPPGPIRMYFCGPTVYARAHIGNARPFVIGMWLRRWLARARLRREARAQHHGHQRQDLRRSARRERRARRARDRLVSPGHRATSVSACPTNSRRRPRWSRRSSPRSRSSSSAATRTRSTATSTTASPSFDEYGRLSGQRPEQVEEQEPNRAQGGPARLRALEGEQAGRGHVRGTLPGAAGVPAGTSSAP